MRGSPLYLPLSAAAILSFLVFRATTARLGALSPIQMLLLPTASALMFWASVVALVLAYPLGTPLRVALQGLKRGGPLVALPPLYFVFHLVVYGVLLERLLVQVFGVGGLSPNGFEAFFSFSYVYQPPNPWNALLTLTVQPALVVTVPPYYSLALGPFSLAMGIIITTLVSASIYQLAQLGGGLRRVGESVAIPALGVVGGASCCLSVPVLLEYFSPAVQALALTPAGSVAFGALYYALPAAVAVALKLAVDGLNRTCRVLGVASVGAGEG